MPPIYIRRYGQTRYTRQSRLRTPANWSMETLPRPNATRLGIRQIPARRMAAVRLSGSPTEKKFKAKAQELTEYLETQGYEIAGAPVYARYAAKPTFEALN